jgi:hypothetical protein
MDGNFGRRAATGLGERNERRRHRRNTDGDGKLWAIRFHSDGRGKRNRRDRKPDANCRNGNVRGFGK